MKIGLEKPTKYGIGTQILEVSAVLRQPAEPELDELIDEMENKDVPVENVCTDAGPCDRIHSDETSRREVEG